MSDYHEIDLVMEAILIDALESEHTLDPKIRKTLPDDCFAVVDGDKKIYPIKVPGDTEKTKELIQKAVQMFHYCKPQYKKQLANALLKAIIENKVKMSISERNQFLKYIDPNKLPKSVVITPTAKKE